MGRGGVRNGQIAMREHLTVVPRAARHESNEAPHRPERLHLVAPQATAGTVARGHETAIGRGAGRKWWQARGR